MEDNKKTKVIIVSLLILIVFSIFTVSIIVGIKSKDSNNDTTSQKNKLSVSDSYILEKYPKDVVPLYDGSVVSSMKYFVNEDSSNKYDDFFDDKRNYYNVVFETDADQKDVFSFYKSKMTDINSKNTQDTTVEGIIGDYKVSISNYGDEDFYLQVHLSEFSKQNIYYSEYPSLVEIADNWVEYENSYGLLNQNNGEIEYTQWFNVDTSAYKDEDSMKVDPIGGYYAIYKEKYKDMPEFEFNDAEGSLTWQSGDYSVSSAFAIDHGRIYLMFRKPMK